MHGCWLWIIIVTRSDGPSFRLLISFASLVSLSVGFTLPQLLRVVGPPELGVEGSYGLEPKTWNGKSRWRRLLNPNTSDSSNMYLAWSGCGVWTFTSMPVVVGCDGMIAFLPRSRWSSMRETPVGSVWATFEPTTSKPVDLPVCLGGGSVCMAGMGNYQTTCRQKHSCRAKFEFGAWRIADGLHVLLSKSDASRARAYVVKFEEEQRSRCWANYALSDHCCNLSVGPGGSPECWDNVHSAFECCPNLVTPEVIAPAATRLLQSLDQERVRAELGQLPASNLQLFRSIFGRVLGAPSVRAHTNDFKGVRSSLRIFVYDLPARFHSDLLELASNSLSAATEQRPERACDSNLHWCMEQRWTGLDGSVRRTLWYEHILVQKFLHADIVGPEEANLFVVPFFMSMLTVLSVNDRQSRIQEVWAHLPHYSDGNAHEHLFFLGPGNYGNLWEVGPGSNLFVAMPLSLGYGANPCDVSPGLGRIVVPSPVLDPVFSVALNPRVAARRRDIFIHSADSPTCCHPIRFTIMLVLRELMHTLVTWAEGEERRTASLVRLFLRSRNAGKDGTTHGISGNFTEQENIAALQRSVLCPVLPGDTPDRHRIYQAVLAGCVPVFLAWPSHLSGRFSYFRDGGPPWEASLPFPSTINWRRAAFFVPPPWPDASDEIYGRYFVETMASFSAAEIRARQNYLDDVARPALTYDFSGEYSDAFTATLDELVSTTQRVAMGVVTRCYEVPDSINPNAVYGRAACCMEDIGRRRCSHALCVAGAANFSLTDMRMRFEQVDRKRPCDFCTMG
eukprot:TRINITY_DN57713_c0_g1_i1.p1 TRINITY_DN57713_c0_g1~~TRINITY_DN57713_c0_g1_i1.p1  ORF type:complete len:806 (-),score=67.23 TRINITY_DN57713_c0_g1_i1:56-2425(-)